MTYKEKRDQLPDELEPLFEALKLDLTNLSARWLIFDGLFRRGDQRLALLSHSAAWFFHTLQRILLDDLLLGIARLLDPPQSRGHDNQSLALLVQQLDLPDAPELRDSLDSQLKALAEACDHILHHRRKRLAHSDRNSRVDPAGNSIPPVPFPDIRAALERCGRIMNDVQLHYTESQTAYLLVTLPHSEDADGVVWALKKAAVLDEFLEPIHHWKLVQQTRYSDA